MAIQASTLRPGLLVSLKTSVLGNVAYTRREIVSEHIRKDGASEAKWETERMISDPKEHRKAREIQSKAGSLIRSVCAKSAFGLLCPEENADELEDAIKAAREVCDDFNAKAKLSRCYVYVITGRVAQDDVEAVRAINSEVRDLMNMMAKGLKNLDVKAVRKAAQNAKNIGSMLSPDAQVRVQLAIDAARSSARKIVKAGERASIEIDRASIRKITEQRTAFLDLDDDAKEIKAPKVSARSVDFALEG